MVGLLTVGGYFRGEDHGKGWGSDQRAGVKGVNNLRELRGYAENVAKNAEFLKSRVDGYLIDPGAAR